MYKDIYENAARVIIYNAVFPASYRGDVKRRSVFLTYRAGPSSRRRGARPIPGEELGPELHHVVQLRSASDSHSLQRDPFVSVRRQVFPARLHLQSSGLRSGRREVSVWMGGEMETG